mmetsp:Transcript_41359/g.103928  ORF Transcript_41359/g.103928 Transcript_41359/m.103928 type:complete len:89 (+) Transcript_41359:1548-1814(+)
MRGQRRLRTGAPLRRRAAAAPTLGRGAWLGSGKSGARRQAAASGRLARRSVQLPRDVRLIIVVPAFGGSGENSQLGSGDYTSGFSFRC